MSGKVQNVNKAEKPKQGDKPSLHKAADKINQLKPKIEKVDKQSEQKSGHKHDESKPKIHKADDQKPGQKTDKHDESKPKIQKVDKKNEQKSGQKTDKQDESKPKIQKVDKKSEQKSGDKPEKHDESKPKIQKADKKGEQKSVHKTEAKADKLKTPQINSEKHEQPKPKIHKVDKHPTSKHDGQQQQDTTIKFQGNLYTLVESPPSNKHNHPICHACAKRIPSSLYHCKAKGWNLHPLCSKLKTKVIDTTTTYTLVQTNDHSRIPCNWNLCKDKTNNSGLSYVSANKDHRFHAYCFMKLMVEISEKKCEHVREGLKREAFLEVVLSFTNIFGEGPLGDMNSIVDLIFG